MRWPPSTLHLVYVMFSFFFCCCQYLWLYGSALRQKCFDTKILCLDYILLKGLYHRSLLSRFVYRLDGPTSQIDRVSIV